MFTWGGGGATIELVLCIGYLVWRKRASKQNKVLAPLTIVPGLFNINEPTMFCLPVVMNLLLIIPFMIAPIISGFLAIGSIAGSILQVINIILDILICLPFIAALNKRQLIEEDKTE